MIVVVDVIIFFIPGVFCKKKAKVRRSAAKVVFMKYMINDLLLIFLKTALLYFVKALFKNSTHLCQLRILFDLL